MFALLFREQRLPFWSRLLGFAAVVVIFAFLAACGGGGDEFSSCWPFPESWCEPPPAPPPAPPPKDNLPPTTPENLSADPISAAQIDLEWNESTDDYGVRGYNVYRDGIHLGHVTGTSTSDAELHPAKEYCYTVSAYDAAGNESAQSSQACATTPPDVTPPTSPTDVVAVPVPTDHIDLSWSAATDDGLILGYNIFRDGTHIQNTTATSFSDTGLSPNTQYCYAVSAYDAGGNESALSAQACTVTSWTITSITNREILGLDRLDPSIALDSTDKPHVSYYENVSIGPGQWIGELRYATNSSGSWVTDTLDSPGYQGVSTSIALDSTDNVHISFNAWPDGGLKYTTNASGIWLTETIDTIINATGSSIAVDSADDVHISHNGNGVLKYMTNASGVWASQDVYSNNVLGNGSTSIALDSTDNVHIIFGDFPNGDLKYFTNSSGSWVANSIDSIGGLAYGSIAVDTEHKVHISYYDSTSGDLKYATNASGVWVTNLVDSEGDVGRFTSIAVDSANNVYVSYYDSSNESIKYTTNFSGAWERYIIDNASGIEGYTSIAVDSADKIHIIYQHDTSLKYANNR